MKLSQTTSLTLLFIATLIFTGCSKTNSEKLVGEWTLDTNAVIKQATETAKTEEDKAKLELVERMMNKLKMKFSFSANQEMTVASSGVGNDYSKTGSYQVESENPLVITSTIEGDTDKTPINFINNDTIELSMPSIRADSGKMILNRVK